MKMIHSMCCAVAVAITITSVTPASAQTRRPAPRRAQQGRVPDTGMMAFGLSGGIAPPTAIDLDTGFSLAMNLERYMTPRVSIRGQIGAAWMDLHGHSFTGQEKPVSFEGNVVYNWEGGKIHPYVTGGLGLEHYRYTEAGLYSSNNHVGGNLGGGVEYFFTRHDTITAEALAHLVSGQAQARATYDSPMYWTILFGYKKYWR